MRLINKTTNEVMATKTKICDTVIQRFIGLLGTKEINQMDACWIKKCNAIHTFGMRYAIDAYFLDKTNTVVGVKQDLKPGRISPIFFKADSVLEMSSNKSRKCAVGDQIFAENLS